MFNKVYIRTRPGADTKITDSMLIAIGDTIRAADLEVITDRCDIDNETLVLALGGDGTMLSAIRLAADSDAIVTGFNFGNLGYLVPDAAKSVAGLTEKLKDLLLCKGGYQMNEYNLPVLKVGKVLAINDFYFVPAATGTALDFEVAIDGESSSFRTKSSGIVISTPFGSTGLALSAGGAILAPNSRVLEIVPMMPHTLTSRPLIVPVTDTIKVSWGNYHGSMFADGLLVDTEKNGEVTIKSKRGKLRIIQPINWNFYDNLRNKMSWHS